jgi:predicted phosphate transport protein (TIGR00153 family)
MAVFTRTTKKVIIRIDEFFDNVELGVLVFREGIKSYIHKDFEAFHRHLQKVDSLESNADKLQRSIENEMITHSILPQHRAEVTMLIDKLDEIMDTIKKSMNEIITEMPVIPEELNKDFITLAESSANAAEELIPAARAYFRAPYTVREKLLKVYYFESETDKLSLRIKKRVFQELEGIELAHKAHLRYIVHHIENISDLAQKAADMLSMMAVKIVI